MPVAKIRNAFPSKSYTGSNYPDLSLTRTFFFIRLSLYMYYYYYELSLFLSINLRRSPMDIHIYIYRKSGNFHVKNFSSVTFSSGLIFVVFNFCRWGPLTEINHNDNLWLKIFRAFNFRRCIVSTKISRSTIYIYFLPCFQIRVPFLCFMPALILSIVG